MSIRWIATFCVVGCLTVTSSPAAETLQQAGPPSSVEKDAAPPTRHFVARVAALGAYRRVLDVPALLAGGELSLGGEGALHGAHGMLRIARGETSAGLTITESSLLGSYEPHWGGFRIGLGGGLTLQRIRRVTSSDTLDTLNFEFMARVGYEFFEQGGPYILGQFDLCTTSIWGPTLYLGYRF